MSVRNFLNWLQKADPCSPNYWDGQFAEAEKIGAGDLPVTRRSLFRQYLEAYQRGDETAKRKILQTHNQAEAQLRQAIIPIYQKLLKPLSNEDAVVLEVACGPGRFTQHCLPMALQHKAHYFAFDSSSSAVRLNRARLEYQKILGWKESENCVVVGDARNFTHLVKDRVFRKQPVLVLLIRFTLHLVDHPIRRKFMREVGELVQKQGGAVLHAETTADHLPEGRVALPGTVFRTGEEVTQELSLQLYGKPKIIWHHEDPIRIASYGPYK